MRVHHLVTAVLTLSAGLATAAGAGVEITGGFKAASNTFEWMITNRSRSPIVYVAFPHYHADALVAPAGWTEESTNLVGTTVPNDPGVCTAKAEMLVDAIAPGNQKKFIMRLSQADTQIGKGTVTVRFADGSEEKIRGIELPVKAQKGFGAAPAIVLAAAFGVYVLVRYLKGRTSPPPPSPSPPREEVI